MTGEARRTARQHRRHRASRTQQSAVGTDARLRTSRGARTSRRLFHLNTRARLCESDDSKQSAQRMTKLLHKISTKVRRYEGKFLLKFYLRTAGKILPYFVPSKVRMYLRTKIYTMKSRMVLLWYFCGTFVVLLWYLRTN